MEYDIRQAGRLPQNQIAPYGEHPLHLTALLYLAEVLYKEQFEEAADVIRIAREFGANDSDIKGIVEGQLQLLAETL